MDATTTPITKDTDTLTELGIAVPPSAAALMRALKERATWSTSSVHCFVGTDAILVRVRDGADAVSIEWVALRSPHAAYPAGEYVFAVSAAELLNARFLLLRGIPRTLHISQQQALTAPPPDTGNLAYVSRACVTPQTLADLQGTSEFHASPCEGTVYVSAGELAVPTEKTSTVYRKDAQVVRVHGATIGVIKTVGGIRNHKLVPLAANGVALSQVIKFTITGLRKLAAVWPATSVVELSYLGESKFGAESQAAYLVMRNLSDPAVTLTFTAPW